MTDSGNTNQSATTYSHMRQHQMFFQEADVNGDEELTCDEFFAALPPRIKQRHTAEEVSQWFGMMDADNNGTVTMGEFLQWSMVAASSSTGTSVLLAFQKADVDDTGTLDEIEFTSVAQKAGIGDYAHKLFAELDKNPDGTINYRQLMDVSKSLKGDGKPVLQSFLMAMAWNDLADDNKLDTTGWTFGCRDASGMDSATQARKELQALLDQYKVKLSDLFEEVDTSDNNLVSEEEFCDGLKNVVGFTGPRHILRQIWATIDYDNSNAVDFIELNHWVKGKELNKRARMNAAKHLTLVDRVEALQEPWSVDDLRKEVTMAAQNAGIFAIDLVDVWGKGESVISKKIWLREFKRLAGVGHDLKWYDFVREAVTDAFELVDHDQTGTLSVSKLAKFLDPKHRLGPPKTSPDHNNKRASSPGGDSEYSEGHWDSERRGVAQQYGFKSRGTKGKALWKPERDWLPAGAAAACAAKTSTAAKASCASHTTHLRDDFAPTGVDAAWPQPPKSSPRPNPPRRPDSGSGSEGVSSPTPRRPLTPTKGPGPPVLVTSAGPHWKLWWYRDAPRQPSPARSPRSPRSGWVGGKAGIGRAPGLDPSEG